MEAVPPKAGGHQSHLGLWLAVGFSLLLNVALVAAVAALLTSNDVQAKFAERAHLAHEDTVDTIAESVGECQLNSGDSGACRTE
jgi:hypothetical protein